MKWRAITTPVLVILLVLAPIVGLADNLTGDSDDVIYNGSIENGSIATTKGSYASGETVEIAIAGAFPPNVTEASENGIFVYVYGPDGGARQLSATRQEDAYIARFLPGRSGPYRACLNGNDTGPSALFMVDPVRVLMDYLILEEDNKTVISVSGSLDKGAGPYDVTCFSSGDILFQSRVNDTKFGFTFEPSLSTEPVLRTVITDADGIKADVIDIIRLIPGENGSPSRAYVYSMEYRFMAYDPESRDLWKIYDISANENPIEANFTPVYLDALALGINPEDLVKRALFSVKDLTIEVPAMNGSIGYGAQALNASRMYAEVGSARDFTAYCEDYGFDPVIGSATISFLTDDENNSRRITMANGVDGFRYLLSSSLPVGTEPSGVTASDGVPEAFMYAGGRAYILDEPVEWYDVTYTPIVMLDDIIIMQAGASAWPSNSSWRPYVNYTWGTVYDPTYNYVPNYVDVSSGGNVSVPIGRNTSCYMYYDQSTRTFFYRILLSATPLIAGGQPFANYMWGIEIDTNRNANTDWGSFINGKVNPDVLQAGFNRRGTAGHTIDVYTYSENASPLNNLTRVVPAGNGIDGNPMYFVDWQIPLANYSTTNADNPGNITEKTRMRIVFGTSNTQRQLDRNIAGSTSINYSISTLISANNTYRGLLGFINDTRDNDAPSVNGTWYNGETVLASGEGWPVNNGTIRNITVRVVNSTGGIMNQTLINYTISNGTFRNVSIWAIPSNGTVPPGIYSIYVKDPRASDGHYEWYDSFNYTRGIMVTNLTVTPNSSLGGYPVRIKAQVNTTFNLSYVRATIYGNSSNMTYNVSSGFYEVTMNAPVNRSTYIVNVTAFDNTTHTGSDTTPLDVLAVYPMLSKTIVWDQTLGRYAITLNATNPSLSNKTIKIYDYIPSGFIATIGASNYTGPVTLSFNNSTLAQHSWYISYVVRGATNSYSSSRLFVSGLDPVYEEP